VSGRAEIWAEFASGPQVLAAARTLRDSGHRELSAFTPYPIPELEEVLELPRPRLLLALVLAGACLGGGLAFSIIWWTAVVSYPLNVGGRPLNSFVTDIPIIFESAVLGAAVTAFAATLGLSGLPRLHHPLDALAGFERSSLDRFWLGVVFDQEVDPELPSALQKLGALRVQRAGVAP
jgi:hypothetical protein